MENFNERLPIIIMSVCFGLLLSTVIQIIRQCFRKPRYPEIPDVKVFPKRFEEKTKRAKLIDGEMVLLDDVEPGDEIEMDINEYREFMKE